MIEIKDQMEIEKYLNKHNIRDLFDTKDLPFQLIRYEAGEIVDLYRPQEKYLKFIVEGSVAADEIDIHGNTKRLMVESDLAFWGEVEICGRSFPNHIREAIETLYCIELPIEPLHDILFQDLKFMQYLVTRMSYSIYSLTNTVAYINYDIEDRLIYYAKYMCLNHTFSGMDATATSLQCSRRQLQRVVSKLLDENKLIKIGSGTYQLIDHS